MNPDKGPEALQRKVQFDLRFYFCRRGMDNMEKMKKMTLNSNIILKVKNGTSSRLKMKNHQKIENIISGVMPENKTDKMCPVQS